jgi:hypothetical protein
MKGDMGDQKVAQTTQVEPSLAAMQAKPAVDAVEPAGVSGKALLGVRFGSRLVSGGPPPPNKGLSDAGLAHPTATRQRTAFARTLQRQRGNAFVQRAVLGGEKASGDTCEREANRFAELVSGDRGRERLHLSRTGLTVQRLPNEGGTAPPLPASTASSPTPSPTKTVLIVEDSVTDLKPGQMRKSEFLSQLRAAVYRTAAEALAGTVWSVVGCPYIARWFRYYSGRSSAQIEQAIHRYAPGAAKVSEAQDCIPLICARVSRGISTWVDSGEVTGVPMDASAELPGGDVTEDGGWLGGIAARVVGGIFFKSRVGGTQMPADPRAIRAQLGSGQALDGSVRLRMESAFGMGFGHVRVHSDATAAGLSRDLNARAFTIGSDVAFGRGEYRPGTPVGDALIAHELAHTVQQGSPAAAVSTLQPQPAGASVLEADADRSAVGAVAALWSGARGRLGEIARTALPRLRSGLSLQRCTKQPTKQKPKWDVGLSDAEIESLAKKQAKFIQDEADAEKRLEKDVEYQRKCREAQSKGLPTSSVKKPTKKDYKATSSDIARKVVKPPKPKEPTKRWDDIAKKGPKAKKDYLNRAQATIEKVKKYAADNKLGSIHAWMVKHPPQITEAIIIETLKSNDFGSWNGRIFKISMDWIDAANAGEWNVIPNIAHEIGGHGVYGEETIDAVMWTYLDQHPDIKKQVTKDKDTRQAFYNRYAYAETEVYAEMLERRWAGGAGLPGKPVYRSDKPNKDIVAKLAQMSERQHPAVVDAVLARIRAKAKDALAKGDIRQEDINFFEKAAQLTKKAWAAFRTAREKWRGDAHAVKVEQKAGEALENLRKQWFASAKRKATEVLKIAQAQGKSVWDAFVSAVKSAADHALEPQK